MADQVDSIGTSVLGQDPMRPTKRNAAKSSGNLADSNANINRDASTASADPANKASKKPKSKYSGPL